MRDSLLNILQWLVDGWFALMPRPAPAHAGEAVKLVAHRGNTGESGAARENTLAAFRRCAELGVWGIEFDIRWCRDDIPVVIHDPDTGRVFGSPPIEIAGVTFDELRARVGGVPSLAEVVDEFGGRCHLMAEIKDKQLSDKQKRMLADHFSGLEPVIDYHLLSLDTAVFPLLSLFPAQAFMAVAETNTREMVDHTRRHRLGSVSGHYLLLSKSLRRTLQRQKIGIGTGFISNRKLLYRELALGSEWLFTNHAAAMQRAADRLARKD